MHHVDMRMPYAHVHHAHPDLPRRHLLLRLPPHPRFLGFLLLPLLAHICSIAITIIITIIQCRTIRHHREYCGVW